MAKPSIPVIHRTPYFTDIAACNICLFFSLKFWCKEPDLIYKKTLYRTSISVVLYSETGVPEMLSTIVSLLGKVYRAPRKFRQRKLKGVQVYDYLVVIVFFPGQRIATF